MATYTYTFSPNTKIASAEVNQNFNDVWPLNWTTWTPGYTGFSADPPTRSARYMQLGKMVVLEVDTGDGTSNANTFTITNVPIQSVTRANQQWFVACGYAGNGGTPIATGQAVIGSGATTITMSVSGSSTGWSASSLKRAAFVLIYETA